jgi:hypothetical protein
MNNMKNLFFQAITTSSRNKTYVVCFLTQFSRLN